MNDYQRKNVEHHHGVGRQIPGCLGRMVNLFDFGLVGSGGKKLLTDKPHFDGSIKRSRIDVPHMEDKAVGINGTPMKKLLAQEMSKEMEYNNKLSSTSVVAKLMGLDSLPRTQSGQKSSSKSGLRRSLSHGEYKDIHEIWQKRGEVSNGKYSSEGLSKKKMDIVREKFMEAKRLVTDDKLRNSKEFQEAMEVLSSHKDLFLEFLQESNNFFSYNLQSYQSAPVTPETKRITVLKPSKTNKAAIEADLKGESGLYLQNWPVEDYPTQSTHIVVLKPNFANGHLPKASSCPTSPRRVPVECCNGEMDDFAERDSRNVARRVKNRQIGGSLKEDSKEETIHSSVFSNGYIGDDSSVNRSRNDYEAGNLSDSEIMSPASKHSWDYINKYDSPFSSSPFSRASCSPESSVCREAKKRLSERWAMMASNENLQESKAIQMGPSTLGDMLALSDIKEDIGTEEASDCIEQGHRVSTSCLAGNINKEEGNFFPLKSLTRSKSLPESSKVYGKSLDRQISDTSKGKSKVPEQLTKSKSLKWSLKSKVSSFLFSRNKKASKERSTEDSQAVNSETLNSRCSDEYEASVSASDSYLQEAGLSITKPATSGNASEWRNEPSPVSVLETSFYEDDEIMFDSLIRSTSLERDMSLKSNLLGKSPPIGSIGRTLSFEDSSAERATTISKYTSKRSTASLDIRDDEEELRLLINTLLLAADFNEETLSDNLISKWHSAESPLDPSLRNKYEVSLDYDSETEQQRLRSNRKLVFDLVNTLLLELTPGYLGRPMVSSKDGNLGVFMVSKMQECLIGSGRVEDRWWDEDGDLSSLSVNKVVRMEVAEIGSPESLRLEMDNMGEELELKLLEELVEEVMMDFSLPTLSNPSM